MSDYDQNKYKDFDNTDKVIEDDFAHGKADIQRNIYQENEDDESGANGSYLRQKEEKLFIDSGVDNLYEKEAVAASNGYSNLTSVNPYQSGFRELTDEGVKKLFFEELPQGSELDSAVRQKVQLNALPNSILIHKKANSHKLAGLLHASAFTYKNHVFFRNEAFDPDSEEGLDLLRHELAHTIQQSGTEYNVIQRAVKVEFQTRNKLWKVGRTKTGTTARRMDRKESRPEYEKRDREEGQNLTYITLGKHGEQERGPLEPGKYYAISEWKKAVKFKEIDNADSEKEPHYIYKYKFKEPVPDPSKLVNKIWDDSKHSLELKESVDNSLFYLDEDYEKDTFRFEFYNGEDKLENFSLNEEGFFIGENLLFGLEMKERTAENEIEIYIKNKSFAKNIEGSTLEEIIANKEGFGVESIDKRKKSNGIPGTSQFILISEDLLEGYYENLSLTEDGRFAISREDKKQLYKKAKKAKKRKEQTAMEMQIDTGGDIEFETPKWFQTWSELKTRIEDAVEMADLLMKPENKIKDQDLIKKMKDNGASGELYTWPKELGNSNAGLKEGESLVTEIKDKKWRARVQYSESIALTQYDNLINEHFGGEEKKINSESSLKRKVYLESRNVRNEIWEEYVFANKAMDESGLLNVKAFMGLVIDYIMMGSFFTGDDAKQPFQIMSRTSFYAMYSDLLSDTERLLYTNIFIDNMSATLKKIDAKAQVIFKWDQEKSSNTKKRKENWDQWRKYRKEHFGKDPGKYLKINGSSFVNRYGYGEELSKDEKAKPENRFRVYKKTGPTISNWLTSIKSGSNSPVRDSKNLQKTDSMSPPSSGSSAMGRFGINKKKKDKHRNLIRMEVRQTENQKLDLNKDEWLPELEERFKYGIENRGRGVENEKPLPNKSVKSTRLFKGE